MADQEQLIHGMSFVESIRILEIQIMFEAMKAANMESWRDRQ